MSIKSRLDAGASIETVARIYNLTVQQVKDRINPPQPKAAAPKPAVKKAARKKATAKK